MLQNVKILEWSKTLKFRKGPKCNNYCMAHCSSTLYYYTVAVQSTTSL